MKAFLFVAAVFAPAGAVAQTSLPALPGYSFPAIVAPADADALLPRRGTPTPAMQRQQLARAIALREEAARLAEANGGTLTPENLRYIQRKADAIMAGR